MSFIVLRGELLQKGSLSLGVLPDFGQKNIQYGVSTRVDWVEKNEANFGIRQSN
jgi:hypothetical protein